MAQPKPPPPALQLVAIFSRHESALDWAIAKVAAAWGEIAMRSPRYEHAETAYYADEMGSDLHKQFLILAGNFDPAGLPHAKLQSNAWENELAQQATFAETRPLNIDPGYLTLTKLVLASCKDRAHRIYLSSGIYAEECLYYLGHGWQARPWTYPDYQRADFHAFFDQARELLKTAQRAGNWAPPTE